MNENPAHESLFQTPARRNARHRVDLGICLVASAQSPCVDGLAAGLYPCDNIDLLSTMGTNQVGGGDMNDIWGWTDPLDGKEYVLLGRTNGTAFIDISDPLNPIYLGNLNTNTVSSLWRDIKVYNNHAFIVSEASGHGMQVFDLTRLRNVNNPPVNFTSDAVYTGFGNAHNIVINEASGRAYGVGTNTASGGLHIVNIQNPLNPTILGTFSQDGYTHDAQVVNYIGTDAQYQGKEIAFACNENTITIVDVTDPTDATLISTEGYSGSAYTHQGWLTEDHRYFVVGDELDEQQSGVNTRTYFFNVEDLDNPFLANTYTATTAAIDHNLYIKDGIAYQSNYRAGLRMLDVSQQPKRPRKSATSICIRRATQHVQRHMVQLPLFLLRRGGRQPHRRRPVLVVPNVLPNRQHCGFGVDATSR